MTADGLVVIAALLVWGTVAGLDLVSVPQAMLARPIVAATVAGWLLGDIEAGLRVGAVLELFALDVLPVGAVRYPDYGPGAVAATAVSAHAPWELSLGVATGLGLVVATVGGWSLRWLRHRNARTTQRRAAALRAGDAGAIHRIQYICMVRDAARALVLTAAGLAVAWLLDGRLRLDRDTAAALTLAAIGAGAASALGGAIRGAGTGARLRWLAVGGAAGLGLATLAWSIG